MLAIIIFIISLVVLIYSAKLVTDSASHFARVLGASEFIVGATVVALGTSLPELSSSLQAMSSGLTGIVVGNVIGSNVANIAIVLGITSIFFIIRTEHNIFKRDIPFLIISAIAAFVVLIDLKVTFIEGIFLLLMYFAYLLNTVRAHKKHNSHKKTKLKYIQLVFFLAGLTGLVYGARYLITSSVEIMILFGISEAILGFVLIALGTSLPELATSIVAARQGKSDMVLGDIVGSNIFNSLVVLGASALVGDVTAGSQFIFTSMPLMIFLTFFLTYIIYDRRITRMEGLTLVVIYILIMVIVS